MIEHYNQVIKRRIYIEKERVTDITYKMKFIIHVLREEIKIIKMKEEIIEGKMKEYDIPFEYYEKSKGKDFSVESYEKYKKLLEETKGKLKTAEALTPEGIWKEKLTTLRAELKRDLREGFFK